MLGVVIVLENEITRTITIVFKGFFECCVQYLDVIILLHGSVVYLAAVAKSLPGHTAPKHKRTASMLDRCLQMEWLKLLAFSHPAVPNAIRIPQVDLGLVGEGHMFPVVDSPVYVCFGPLVARCLLFV